MSDDKYSALGASASKKGVHEALEKSGVSAGDKYFANVISDFAGSPDYRSFIHCDGAGTKSIVSYLLYREFGDPSVFESPAQDALVMNLDDIFCLGQPETMVLSNLINRNSRLVGDDAVEAIVRRYRLMCDELREYGVEVELGGGETADCGDVTRTLAVDAIVAGRISCANLIDPARIIPGDVIVGFSSSGKASYERETNSGIGSNGLTLARHALLSKSYLEQYPEIGDPGMDAAHAYTGPYRLDDKPDGLGMTVGDALRSPTRTFTPLLAAIYKKHPGEIHGAIHLTGGAHTKVLRFGLGNRYIKDNLFEPPTVFRLIQEAADVSPQEMYKVFNMGQRFELYVSEDIADSIISLATEFGIDAQRVGHVGANPKSSEQNEVVLESSQGTFNYTL